MPKNLVFLAFDFGLRRIGVAVGQTITQSATPLPALLAQKGEPDWEEISQLIIAWHPTALLVGLPYQMNGSEQALSFAARKFARDLTERCHLPVHLADERLTTREAKRQLAQSGAKYKDLASADSYAAKLILEAWMNSEYKKEPKE